MTAPYIDTEGARRKGQFFIIATVLISGALLFIVTMLTAVADLEYTESMSRHDRGLMDNIAGHGQDLWWNTDWTYRTGVTVEEQDAAFLYREPVPIVLPATRSQVRDDCGDIRVIQDGQEMLWNETTGCDIDTYDSESDAIARYQLDEGEGQQANDSTDFGHDGTLHGSPDWVTGQFDTGLELDGDSDYVEIEHDDTLNVQNGSWTVMGWVYQEQDQTGGIMSKPGSSWFYIGDGGILSLEEGDDPWSGVYTPSGSISTNTWHHVAATQNETDHVRLFVDGEQQANGTLDLGISDDDMYLGTWDGDIQHWPGILEDVRVYDEELRPDQIEGIHQNGIGLNITVDLGPLETTENLFVYHGNSFALRPDYTGTAIPSPLENRPHVIEVGTPRERGEMRTNLERNVERLDDAVGPSLEYEEINERCSIVHLRSSFSVLQRQVCLPSG